ncbi:MAG TPA: hypothetical protein VFX85_09310 [Solirubrobacterales bacterium]|nr:hypothetical protein [Solirubrobacterales bacterium]
MRPPRASIGLFAALAFAVTLLLPAGAGATIVGLGATAAEPSECFEPRRSRQASTYCQVFAGDSLEIAAVASRDDGSVRLAPQPFTLLEIGAGPAQEVLSFTYFDDNDADDEPRVTPRRNTDYQLRFNGNEVIGPAESAPLVAEVGARVSIPEDASSGNGTRLRIPAGVAVPWRSLKGRLELRRCHRAKATSAASCARRSSYTVLASRTATADLTTRFQLAAPPRSYRRYEVAFDPRGKRFATTRRAFTVLNGFDGVTSYRPTVRSAPFGNR